jgi:hypothetical protein
VNSLNPCQAKTLRLLQKLLASEEINGSAEEIIVAISTGIE